jgi:hypothetical protein
MMPGWGYPPLDDDRADMETEWSEVKSQQRKLRLAAAGIGVGVLVTMGAITFTGTGSEIKMSGQPTLGETSKSSTPPSTPATKQASPMVTASTSEGEWAPMPAVKPAG